MVESLRIKRSALGRGALRVLEAVQRGEVVLVEDDGRPEAAILDIVDYRLLRAVARYYACKPEIDVEAGLTDDEVAAAGEEQARYDLILAYYLGGSLSTGRTAQLLRLPWIEMRERFNRLDIPFFTGPTSLEELREELEAYEAWARQS